MRSEHVIIPVLVLFLIGVGSLTARADPPTGEPVPIPEAHRNADPVATVAEQEATATWYDYWKDETTAYQGPGQPDPAPREPTPADWHPYDYWGSACDAYCRAMPYVFTWDFAWPAPYYAMPLHRPQNHVCWQSNRGCPAHDPDDPASMPTSVSTAFGDYQLAPFDDPVALAQALDNLAGFPWLPATPSAVRLGTERGHFNGDPEGHTVIDVPLDPGDRTTYSRVNFLLSGEGFPDYPHAWTDSMKRAWFRIYALYADDPENAVQIFESPKMFTYDGPDAYGDERDDVAGGVPTMLWRSDWTLWHPDWTPVLVCLQYWNNQGGQYPGGYGSYEEPLRSGYRTVDDQVYDGIRLWEPAPDGLALDPARTLEGFRFEVDAGPALYHSGYPEGDTVTIWAVSGIAVEWVPITVRASLDEDWTYQNAPETTLGRHGCTLTVSVADDPNGNTTYDVALAADPPDAVILEPTADPLVWNVLGGQSGADPTGTCTLDVTVTGIEQGGEGQTSTSVQVRNLGDVDGSGFVNVLDKVQLNLRLNGQATPYDDRCFDFTGDGFVNVLDKVQINRALNGIPIP